MLCSCRFIFPIPRYGCQDRQYILLGDFISSVPAIIVTDTMVQLSLVYFKSIMCQDIGRCNINGYFMWP